jgi:hypothetical protein
MPKGDQKGGAGADDDDDDNDDDEKAMGGDMPPLEVRARAHTRTTARAY